MPYQSAAEHPAYTQLDRYWPIQLEYGDSGDPVKLLIKDQFAPFAEKIYNLYKRVSDLSVISEWTNLTDKLPEIPKVTVEFGGVAIFVVRILISAVLWAARRGIELSRFKLHTGGWIGDGGGVGWTPMGGVIYREC